MPSQQKKKKWMELTMAGRQKRRRKGQGGRASSIRSRGSRAADPRPKTQSPGQQQPATKSNSKSRQRAKRIAANFRLKCSFDPTPPARRTHRQTYADNDGHTHTLAHRGAHRRRRSRAKSNDAYEI